jgi:ABC-2 type transport system permease protein
LRTILTLIRKEYRLFWSDRVAVSLTFLIPFLLIMIWGSVFGKLGSGSSELRLAFVNASSSPVGKRIETLLDSTKSFRLVKSYTDETGRVVLFDTASVQDFVRKGNVAAALVVPPDAYTENSLGLKLTFYYDPRNDIEIQTIAGLLQQTIMTQIPSLAVQSLRASAVRYLGLDSGSAFNGEIARTVHRYFGIDVASVLRSYAGSAALDTGASRAGAVFKNIISLDQVQLVGKDVANPWATRSVGGWAMMFLLFTVSASASSLFDEKKSGVVLRILASPISRVQILWSKYLYNMSLGIIQLLVLFTGGALLFRIDIGANFFNLVLVIGAASIACTAFGMLLAAVCKTSAQANGLGTFLILAMSSVGGAWFPTSMMPDFIQSISKFTIVYWSMDGFLQVLWRGAGTWQILPNLAVLLLIAGVTTTVSFWQFKKGHVF